MSDEAKEVYNSLVETQILESTADTNPLRMLRSGLPVVRPRIRGNKQFNLGHVTSCVDDIAELSESRISFDQHHGVGTSSLPKIRGLPSSNLSLPVLTVQTLERHNSIIGIENNQNQNNVDDNNPIPLPPRDRSKTLQPKSNLPRHQRKHPLIIPGDGVSRTLAKMATCSIGDQVDGRSSSFDISDAVSFNKLVTITPSTPNFSNR